MVSSTQILNKFIKNTPESCTKQVVHSYKNIFYLLVTEQAS